MLDLMTLLPFEDVEALIRHLLPGAQTVNVLSGAIAGIGGGGASNSAKVVAAMPADENDRTLFVKILRADSHAKVWEDKLDIFKKEITFYREILPALSSPQFELAPKFLGAGRIASDVYVVLEDFGSLGFKVVRADRFLDDAAVETCLEGIADFHSLSAGKSHMLETWKDTLADRVNAADNEDTVKQLFCRLFEANLRLLKAVLQAKDKVRRDISIPEGVSIEILDKLIGFAPRMLRVFRHLRSPREEQYKDLLIHGDFHMWNVALKGDEMRMFDFQIVCRGSAGCDLHHFLSQSPDPKSRRDKWRQWLGVYRQRFNHMCSSRGLPEVSCQELEDDYRHKAPIGLLCGVAFVLRRFVSEGDEKEAVDAAEKCAFSGEPSEKVLSLLSECSEAFWNAMQWNFDMVDEYCNEMNAVETIEKALEAEEK